MKKKCNVCGCFIPYKISYEVVLRREKHQRKHYCSEICNMIYIYRSSYHILLIKDGLKYRANPIMRFWEFMKKIDRFFRYLRYLGYKGLKNEIKKEKKNEN